MSWKYRQKNGELSHNGVIVGYGYSGRGTGRDNPAMQNQHNIGPIPRGFYRIGSPRDSFNVGPVALNLTPIGHNALGRTLFTIHGDNRDINFTASKGCIILKRCIREKIAASGDTRLEVVY